jgi:hypothetical protein
MARKPAKNLRSRQGSGEQSRAQKDRKLTTPRSANKPLERYARWVERERENTDAAYDDLKFRAGEQWDKAGA